MDELIRIQRDTVDEHVRAENAHNWPAVYGTFVQDEDSAFFDVVPLHTHFAGITGVKDFYRAAAAAFPDFQLDVWGEVDAPGCSLREVTFSGTHKGRLVRRSRNRQMGEVSPRCLVFVRKGRELWETCCRTNLF